MRVCLLDHHRKPAYLGSKLQEAGFDLVGADEDFSFDVLLVDTDHPEGAPAPYKHAFVKEAMRRGVQIGLYPHGGLPVLDYDGMRKPGIQTEPRVWSDVAFELVHGEGHKACYDAIGLKRRVEVVGWSYTDVLPRSEGPINHLVFAPIHPWADGMIILPIHQRQNEIAYEVFLSFPGVKTVRQFGEDEPNGVTHRVEGVEYTQSDLGLGLDLIDRCDAVISYGTFACTALARGKPTVMIYPYPPHMDDFGQVEARRWLEYGAETRYPASISETPLEELFAVDTSDWERRFVGGPLDIEHVADTIRSFKLNRKQRREKVRR